MGTVGPSFMVDQEALVALRAMGEEIPIEDLTVLGIHPSVETSLRHNGVTAVKKTEVYEWLTRGIPGPIGEIGPPGCPAGPPGPPGMTAHGEGKNGLPWYVTHLMKQTRRQGRMQR